MGRCSSDDEWLVMYLFATYVPVPLSAVTTVLLIVILSLATTTSVTKLFVIAALFAIFSALLCVDI